MLTNLRDIQAVTAYEQAYTKNIADSASPAVMEDTARTGYRRCEIGGYSGVAYSNVKHAQINVLAWAVLLQLYQASNR